MLILLAGAASLHNREPSIDETIVPAGEEADYIMVVVLYDDGLLDASGWTRPS